jgi:predicted flavoprotein YhiN
MTKKVEPGEQVECEECIVAVGGLFWQDAGTGEFDILLDITEYVEEIPG